MPRKKPEPYMVLQTREDFDKLFHEIFRNGEEKGRNDGLAEGISMIYEMLMRAQDELPQDTITNAEWIAGYRMKKRFKLEQCLLDKARKKAVEDYKASTERENEE